MGGYWAMGSATTAMAPASVMTIESTAAKMGRSMKKREIMGSHASDLPRRLASGQRPSVCACAAGSSTGNTGMGVSSALDGHLRPHRLAVLRQSPVLPAGGLPRSRGGRLPASGPVFTRPVLDDDLSLTASRNFCPWSSPKAFSLTSRAGCGLPKGKPHAHEHSRPQQPLAGGCCRVVEGPADGDRARGSVDDVVAEVDDSPRAGTPSRRPAPSGRGTPPFLANRSSLLGSTSLRNTSSMVFSSTSK